MILAPFIPFLSVLGIGYYYFTTSLESNTVSHMKRIVEDHRQMIDTFLNERKADLRLVCDSYTLDEIKSPRRLREVFVHLQGGSNAFVDLGVFSGEGVHIAYFGSYKLVGRDYGETDWFKKVIKQGYYISDVFLGYRKIPHFIIAVAKQVKGKRWVLRATIDTYMFNNLVKKVRIGKTGEAYILSKNGVFQTERRSGGDLMNKNPIQTAHLPSNGDIKTFISREVNGEKYLYATTWLKGKDWLLFVRQQKDDAFSALRSASFLILLISMVGGGAITGLSFYLTERVIMRMRQLDDEAERLSGQLIRASRLAELGEMAAGFAHEINNPLQIIQNEQALIYEILSDLKKQGEFRQSEPLEELEDSIHQTKIQIDRCAKITQAILKFGRKSESVSRDLDMERFIPEVVGMVANNASVHGITINQDILKDTPPIHVDPAQLQQVFINLFNNAIDAIIASHGSSGGKLDIMALQKDNGIVEILVRDNGCGISPENMEKIFSPFYTTKPVGKGTGMGLSVCYGIIDNMGGVMEVSSEVGVGTTFTIRLPAAV